MSDLLEKLANYEHNRWSRWQKYLHSCSIKNSDGSITIPKDKVDRWERQLNTNYDELSEEEKESDRKEAIRIIAILNELKGEIK